MISYPTLRAFQRITTTLLAATFAILMTTSADADNIDAATKAKIEAALPSEAPATPKKKRLILVTNMEMRDGKPWQGSSHAEIPAQNYAFKRLGEVTGAYTAVFDSDPTWFSSDSIHQFDAICFLNSVGVLFDDKDLRASLLDYIENGGGIIGIHDAIATFVQYPVYDQWPAFGQMMGGTENGGHPWNGEPMTIAVEDKKSPITKAFKGKSFVVADQAFQLQEPTFRDKLRILLSIDVANTVPPQRVLPIRKDDMDFPISWIREYGEGRVFYNGFGHNAHVFWNPELLEFTLAGVQYALGDLEADATPSAEL